MGLRELKAEYAEQYQYSGYVKESELNRYLDAGLEFFEARGIELPSEGDFSLWEEQLLTTLKPNTVRHYIREFRKFTDWCRQKRDRSMSLDFEATTTEATSTGGVNPQLREKLPEAETVEFAEDTPKRRGRKSKPEADRRSVKISIYLTPSLYEGVRLLASARQEDISDVIFSVLDDFVDRNSDKISTVRDFFASLGVIK